MDERTYGKTEIRGRRLALEQQVALQQRELEVLAKIDDAYAELERIEREKEARSRGETRLDPQSAEPEAVSSEPQPAEPEVPVRAVPSELKTSDPQAAEHASAEPQTPGLRAEKILKDQANTWLTPREVLVGLEEHGWVNGDPEAALSRLRHSLRRLAHSHANIQRDESGTTYRYRYVLAVGDQAPTFLSHANGAAHPALGG